MRGEHGVAGFSHGVGGKVIPRRDCSTEVVYAPTNTAEQSVGRIP